ncbi:MAG: hypothetical protein KDA41_18640 [Planctomycetales bacterium]|nr:hypothetical protein [Planctomycetales bacterium]
MKIQIESTDQVTEINGVPVRLWQGTTEDGVDCHVFVHRIAVAKQDDCSAFERELTEKLPPPVHVPLHHIL